MSERPILSAKGICKSFGKNQVLYDVDFDIRPGEVHALIGENGAGKSTLIRILFGMHKASAGAIEMSGQQVSLANPMEAKLHGMAMINQEPLAFIDMTILENIFLGHLRLKKSRVVDFKSMEKNRARAAEKAGPQHRRPQQDDGHFGCRAADG